IGNKKLQRHFLEKNHLLQIVFYSQPFYRNTMAKLIADQLVETIAQAGIKRIYAVAGDSLNEVNDAVRRSSDIEWIHVRHEETGAFAAAAEAELNGIACCAGSSGPGHVHLIN